MSAAAGKLNLRPQERRLAAAIGLGLFVVINVVWVWPHFGDWNQLQNRQDSAQRKYDMYRREIGRTNSYMVKLRELEHMGSIVVPEEQELDLVRRIDTDARAKGLYVMNLSPRQSGTTQTNSFFEEQDVQMHATSDGEQLVNFLIGLTSSNSLIRVKDMMLKPADPTVTKLDEAITLVASYQRKAPAKNQPATISKPALVQPGLPRPGAARGPAATNKARATSPTAHPTNKPAMQRTRMTNSPAKKP
jgi:Tfp pilus assembly protein PilO